MLVIAQQDTIPEKIAKFSILMYMLTSCLDTVQGCYRNQLGKEKYYKARLFCIKEFYFASLHVITKKRPTDVIYIYVYCILLELFSGKKTKTKTNKDEKL